MAGRLRDQAQDISDSNEDVEEDPIQDDRFMQPLDNDEGPKFDAYEDDEV